MRLTQEALDRLATEFKEICRHARGLVETVGGEVDAQGAEALTRLSHGLDGLKERCRVLEEKLQSGMATGDRVVRENPYRVIAGALAAGLLLGWLLGGRKRS